MNETEDLALSSSPQNIQAFVDKNGQEGIFFCSFLRTTNNNNIGITSCLHYLLSLAKSPSSKSKMDVIVANLHTTLSIHAFFYPLSLRYLTI